MEDIELKKDETNAVPETKVETKQPEFIERSKPTVPLGKYTKEKDKRQDFERELNEKNELLAARDKELAELRQSKPAGNTTGLDERTMNTINYLAEREFARQNEESFNKDFNALVNKYPESNTPEAKQYLQEIAGKYPETPFDVLYKASDLYHKNSPTIETGKKSVDDRGSKATIDVKNPSAKDWEKLQTSSDEDWEKYVTDKYSVK